MISVTIMAHPKRDALVADLLTYLDPSVTRVVWDEKDDVWDTGERSIFSYHPEASHHLVIQDDAVPCRDLLMGVEEMVKHTGDHLVSLYMGRPRPHPALVSLRIKLAKRMGHSYVDMPGPLWGVGILFPVGLIREMESASDLRSGSSRYDVRIARFLRMRGMSCLYTVPSLVDHRVGRDNPSLFPGKDHERRAWEFIGEEVSATSVDWSLIPPEELPLFLEWENGKRSSFLCTKCGHHVVVKKRMEEHLKFHERIKASRSGRRWNKNGR